MKGIVLLQLKHLMYRHLCLHIHTLPFCRPVVSECFFSQNAGCIMLMVWHCMFGTTPRHHNPRIAARCRLEPGLAATSSLLNSLSPHHRTTAPQQTDRRDNHDRSPVNNSLRRHPPVKIRWPSLTLSSAAVHHVDEVARRACDGFYLGSLPLRLDEATELSDGDAALRFGLVLRAA